MNTPLVSKESDVRTRLNEIAWSWRWCYHKLFDDQLTPIRNREVCALCDARISVPYHCFDPRNNGLHIHVHARCFPDDLHAALAIAGRVPDAAS